MEEILVKELVAEYKSNRDRALALAFHTVSNIEIPVFNTLSSLSRQSLLQLLNNLGTKFKQMSASTQKSLMVTLITDVLTSVIKYNDFYESFEGNNLNIIQSLCRKIIQISRVRIDEYEDLQPHVKQMKKYADRIPQYIELKKCLSSIQNVPTFRHNFYDNQEPVQRRNRISNFVPRKLRFTDTNENILKESYTPNILKRKHFEIESNTQTINKYFESKPKIENQNNIKLPEIKPKDSFDKTDQSNKLSEIKLTNIFVNTDQSNIKLPEIKPKNAFDLLMSSARNKIAKK